MKVKTNTYSGVKGALIESAPLGEQSWFGCGGKADLLFKPADIEDLAEFLKQCPKYEPITIIGGLANTIIRDGGIRGVTIQLGKDFANITTYPSSCGSTAGSQSIPTDAAIKSQHDTPSYIKAECGALNGSISAAAVKAGIGGLEFLSGIPGSFGGALRMNAGAYGSEIKDVFVAANAIDREGKEIQLTAEDMYFAYRHCGAHAELIFTSAILKGRAEDYETVKSRMNDIKAKRNETQPIREKTGGSTFANPHQELRKAGLPEDTRAWQIVEKVGGRGLIIGGAQMSEKHCNFMINTGNSTASDLENLGNEIRARALNQFGLNLHWEIKRIGEK